MLLRHSDPRPSLVEHGPSSLSHPAGSPRVVGTLIPVEVATSLDVVHAGESLPATSHCSLPARRW